MEETIVLKLEDDENDFCFCRRPTSALLVWHNIANVHTLHPLCFES